MALTFDDDKLTHKPTDHIDFRESYYCNFCDTKSDLCGFAWQGVRPNANVADAVFLLIDGQKDLIRSVRMGLPVAEYVREEGRRIGPQGFECLDPWRHWQVRYEDGENKVRVDWQQMSSVCDWEWEDLTNSKHCETAGRVTVEARVAGRDIRFSGYGERDRAWGQRNYGPLKFSWWLTVQYPDGVAAQAEALRDPTGKYRLLGFLHKDGQTRGLKHFEASDIVWSADGGPPQAARQLLVDDLGRELQIARTEPLNYLGFGTDSGGAGLHDRDRAPADHVIMLMGFYRFVREDGVVGRGMIDNHLSSREKRVTSFAADPPLYSILYPYGREQQAAKGK